MKEIWFVRGDPNTGYDYFPTLFDTKMAAEVYARQCFPDEHPDSRYARIFYRELLTLDDVKD
jgi:hypothetical protein